MIKKVYLLTICLLQTIFIFAKETKYHVEVKPLGNEKWWGGMIGLGSSMPFEKDLHLYDLSKVNLNNQNIPLFVSSAGRYIWSDKPFSFKIDNGVLSIYSDYEQVAPVTAGKTIKEAYHAAAINHFPPTAKLPDSLLFSMPQYNTWIELQYNQNQKDILNYADNVLKHDFPAGVFMIDDNWQKYYGNFDFKPEQFPDPKGMVKELHSKGFKVMLWICPFVGADSPEFRYLQKRGFLIKQKGTNNAAIIPWWNGYSASYDLSNPEAVKYFTQQLRDVQKKYNIDGFKFDAGDISHYDNDNLSFYNKEATSTDMCEYWLKIGLDFPFNEYRAGWKMGNQPLVQRLGDKDYSWNALRLLIPDMLAMGLMGYAYACPDMIGGGQISSFLDIDQTKLDQELIVRSCQVHAMMPMMQFSVAPWRILDAKHLKICRDFSHLHKELSGYILELARKSSHTSEPIIRHMEYSFPNQGFTNCKDQFMLGDKYLVAPMITKGTSRNVSLPKGVWVDDMGEKFRGPKTITIDVPLERLPYFEKIK